MLQSLISDEQAVPAFEDKLSIREEKKVEDCKKKKTRRLKIVKKRYLVQVS